MPLPFIDSYKIEMTDKGFRVPLINGIHLHSIYDPEKEARDLIKENLNVLSEKKTILVLGLGLGYHLNELISFLKSHWGNDYLVAVVEPLDRTVTESEKIGMLPPENVLIFSGMEIEDLFSNATFANFLLGKPGILAHPPSLNLFNDYFKKLMSYRAPKTLEHATKLIHSPDIRIYLSQFDQNNTFEHFLNNDLTRQDKLEGPNDFLFHAIRDLERV